MGGLFSPDPPKPVTPPLPPVKDNLSSREQAAAERERRRRAAGRASTILTDGGLGNASGGSETLGE